MPVARQHASSVMQQLKAATYGPGKRLMIDTSRQHTVRPSLSTIAVGVVRAAWLGLVVWICCAIGRISRRLPALLNLETSSSGAAGGSQYGSCPTVGSGTQGARLVPSGDHECRPCQILNAGLCCVRLRSGRRLDAWLSPEHTRGRSCCILSLSLSLSVWPVCCTHYDLN